MPTSKRLGDLRLVEHRVESFFLDERNRAEAAARAEGLDFRLTEIGAEDSRIVQLREIVAHLDRAETNYAPAMRLGKMPPGIVNDVPIEVGVFIEIIGQQKLREIMVRKRLSGLLLDVRPRRVHQLSCVGRILAVAAHLRIGLRHDLPRRLFELDSPLMGHPRIAMRPRGRAAFLLLARPRPLLRAGENSAHDVVRHAAINLLRQCRPPLPPRSRSCLDRCMRLADKRGAARRSPAPRYWRARSSGWRRGLRRCARIAGMDC
jgi:hypothetical protein